MHDISSRRLLLLRGMYLLVALAMGAQTWPLILRRPAGAELLWGVVLPSWSAGELVGGKAESMVACVAGMILFPMVILGATCGRTP